MRKSEGDKKGIKKVVLSGLIGIVVLSLVFGLGTQSVSAAFSKKMPISINNTGGGALSYYQISLNVTYDSDMNNDFSDIRVKNETSGTFVPYWIEEKVNGSYANIWFNATSIPASAWCNDTYYLYYGNPSASSESNGAATFEFFDDFDVAMSFGVINSVEYGQDPTSKLESAVDDFNSWNPNAVISVGDFIYRASSNKTQALSDLDTIEAVYNNLTMNRYYCFGNHDLDYLSKSEFFNHTGKSEKYHSFDIGDYHFIVLDSMFNSSGDDWEECVLTTGSECPYTETDLYIPDAEKTWLQNDLNNTSKKTVVFMEAHFEGGPYKIGNDVEIRTILEDSGKVIATFSGNSGANNHVTINGIDHYQLYAMDVPATNAYAKVTIFTNDNIYIEGIGEQSSYHTTIGDEWVMDNGSWEVVNGTLRGNTSDTYARIHAGQTITNYSFHFSQIITSNYIGPMFRFVDTSNYYYYHAITDDIKKVVGGSASVVSSTTAINESLLHDFEVQLLGDNIEIFCDGTSIGSATDSSLSSGKIGALVWSSGTGKHDNMRVRNYASPEPTALFGSEAAIDGAGAYNITLLSGWNLIGWTDTTTKTAHTVGGLIGSNCTYVVERNRTMGEYVSHNMAGPESENNFNLGRGWGYYVYVSEEMVWNRTG